MKEDKGKPAKRRSSFRRWLGPASSGSLLTFLALYACSRPPGMPAVDGAQLQISRSEGSMREGEFGIEETLQVIWFGSACHELRLGELSVVTDPFVTNGFVIGSAVSDGDRVKATLGKLKPPAVVLVNHSHHDHLLDAHEAMILPKWEHVQLWGGETCKNILSGWMAKDIADHKDVIGRCHKIDEQNFPKSGKVLFDLDADDPGKPSGYTLKVTAYPGVHPPHVGCSTVLFDGEVKKPLSKPPNTVGDYKLGEVFNYLVEMGNTSTRASFKVFLLGGPGSAPPDLPKGVAPVDVVILPSPGAEKVQKNLVGHLQLLEPRHVIINHFNNLFEKDKDSGGNPETQTALFRVDLAKLQYASREVQNAVIWNGRFERLHIPAISVMKGEGIASNVTRIKPASRGGKASGNSE